MKLNQFQTESALQNRVNHYYYPVIILIIVAGLWFRLYQSGTDSLWIDEAYTGFIALTSEWLQYLQSDNTPPLYYGVMRTWCNIVSCDQDGIRLISVLSGLVFTFVVWLFCHQFFGKRVAVLMTLVAVTSPLHFYYSQEARVYALLMTMLLLFLYLQMQVLERRPTMLKLVMLTIIGTCLLYLHYFAVFVVGACMSVYLFEHMCRIRTIPRSYFIAVGCALLLFLPGLFIGVFGAGSTSTELGWITEYLQDKSLWQLPFRTLQTFIAGPQLYYSETNLFIKRYSRVDLGLWARGISVLLTMLFSILYIYSWMHLKRQSVQNRLFFIEASAFVVLPLLALLVITIFLRPVYVPGRYDLIAYPAFLLLLASMLSMISNTATVNIRNTVAGTILVFCALLSGKIIAYQSSRPYQAAEARVSAIVDNIADGDGLLVASPRAVQIWYYLHLAGFDRVTNVCSGPGKAFVCRLFPQNLEPAPALQTRYQDVYQRTDEQAFNISYFLDQLEHTARVFLIVDQLTLEQGNLELDPVGYKILQNLVRAGYRTEQVLADDKMIIMRQSDE